MMLGLILMSFAVITGLFIGALIYYIDSVYSLQRDLKRIDRHIDELNILKNLY